MWRTKTGELGSAVQSTDYLFEQPHFTPAQIENSQRQDRRGFLHAQLYGRPLMDAKGEVVRTDENEEGDPFEAGGSAVRFVLWRDVLLDGKAWLVGSKNPLVPESRVTAKNPGRGGDLGRWIYPAVVSDELKVNPNAKAEEAWGWLPPPLVGEGKKVQTRWAARFSAGAVSDSPGRRAADAEVQYELERCNGIGRLFRGKRQCAGAV